MEKFPREPQLCLSQSKPRLTSLLIFPRLLPLAIHRLLWGLHGSWGQRTEAAVRLPGPRGPGPQGGTRGCLDKQKPLYSQRGRGCWKLLPPYMETLTLTHQPVLWFEKHTKSSILPISRILDTRSLEKHSVACDSQLVSEHSHNCLSPFQGPSRYKPKPRVWVP